MILSVCQGVHDRISALSYASVHGLEVIISDT